MNWEARYQPTDPENWHGRVDAPPNSAFFQRIQIINLPTFDKKLFSQKGFALIGFKCDEGASRDLRRIGAFEGPYAIRRRLANMPLHHPNLTIYDVGNIFCHDHDLEASQLALGEVVQMLISAGLTPLIIGGGHEVAFGHYLGLAPSLKKHDKLGVISFDSHFDLHPLGPTHRASATTTFYQIAKDLELKNKSFNYACIGVQRSGNSSISFDIADQLHVNYLLSDDLHLNNNFAIKEFSTSLVENHNYLLLSLSMDVFAPAFAPGVSSSEPLGLTPWQVIPLLRYFANSGKAISYDICEHVPRYDIDHRTAKLAANLIYEIIHHHTFNK